MSYKFLIYLLAKTYIFARKNIYSVVFSPKIKIQKMAQKKGKKGGKKIKMFEFAEVGVYGCAKILDKNDFIENTYWDRMKNDPLNRIQNKIIKTVKWQGKVKSALMKCACNRIKDMPCCEDRESKILVLTAWRISNIKSTFHGHTIGFVVDGNVHGDKRNEMKNKLIPLGMSSLSNLMNNNDNNNDNDISRIFNPSPHYNLNAQKRTKGGRRYKPVTSM